MESRLILTVHDEPIVEAPEAEAERPPPSCGKRWKACAVTPCLPLSTDVHIGKNWLEAH